jgi:Tol biopolymer transport system component
MNPDGTGDREVPGQTAAVNLFPTVSPDSKRIAFMAGSDLVDPPFRIEVVDLGGGPAQMLEGPHPKNGRPAWSADGTRIAFSTGTGTPGIFVWDLKTGGTRAVTPPGAGGASPFWRPDGAIGYTRLKADLSSELAFIRPDGTGDEAFLSGEKLLLAGANALSPDGKRLAYFALDLAAGMMSLRLWEFAEKSETTLLESPGHGLRGFAILPAAAWTPDGETLLASLPTEKGLGLFRISGDGKTRTRLTPDGVDCLHPAWLGT